jgi:8-oxo-dGTP pyrophosphatase MutT (NUDIX family)
MQKRNGVYSWLTFNPGNSESGSVFIPLLEEDKGKEESVDGEIFIPLSLGMLGIAGGAVEPEDDTLLTAIQREISQELMVPIAPEQITNGLPSFQVHQKRNGQVVDFAVTGFNTSLTPEQVEILRHEQDATIVPNSQLETFLAENKNRLRPYVHKAGFLIVQRLRN